MSVIFLRTAAGAGCAALCLAASARAEAPLPVEALKRAYIDCECAAQATRLAASDAETCAVLYEELKARAFGNDFGALLDWYRQEMRQKVPAS